MFYSYVDGSVKDAERIRRCKSVPIEISETKSDVPLPIVSQFWSSPMTRQNSIDISDSG